MSEERPSTIAYPEVPRVPGALPRLELAQAARTEFAVWGDPNDYDLLCGAMVLNSRPSASLALELGAPIIQANSSMFHALSTYYNDSRQKPVSVDQLPRGGTAREGLEWLRFLLEHPACPTGALIECGELLAMDAVRWGNLHVLNYLDHPDRMRRYFRSSDTGLLLLQAAALPHAAESLQWLLKRSQAQIETIDSEGNTALLAAAAAAHQDRVHLLLEQGADPAAQNRRNQNILHHCALANLDGDVLGQYMLHVLDLLPSKVIDQLINQSDDNGFMPIHDLAMSGANMDWKRLSPKGDVDTFTLPGHVVQSVKGAPDITELSALGVAFLMLNSRAAQELLSAGASLDRLSAKGHTGWHLLACTSSAGSASDLANRRTLARLLYQANVSIEQTNKDGLHPMAFADSDKFDRFVARHRRRVLGASLDSSCPVPDASMRPRRTAGL